VVIVGLMVFFIIYADHLTRSHNSGLITPEVLRSLSVLRL
jgi:hypothetical protein